MKSTFIKTISVALIFYLVTYTESIAANIDSTKTIKGLSIGYWGTMKYNYGLQIGLDKNLMQTEKYKVIRQYSLVFQVKPKVYTSAGIIISSALRRTFRKGIYFEQSVKFGYLGSYYNFDLYKTNSDGDIVNIGHKWKSSIILGYSLGLGYDFSKLTKTDFQFYLKPNIYYRFPNNDNIFYLNNYSIEVGIILHPKWIK
jgi:hypothetical protein